MSGRLYGTRRWRRRAAEQLQREPLCAFHLQRGLTIAATVADHNPPHNGDELAFWEGPLQSLCKACHDQDKQREELVGFTERLDDDGWPADPRHLANAPGQAPRPLRRRWKA